MRKNIVKYSVLLLSGAALACLFDARSFFESSFAHAPLGALSAPQTTQTVPPLPQAFVANPATDPEFAAQLAELTPEERVPVTLYATRNKSIVNVSTVETSNSRFFQQVSEGCGSGIVINKQGVVLTNFHVVENASKIDVTLFNGETYPATPIGVDPNTDVALLKIDVAPENLFPVEFGDSSKLLVGQTVYAIGNPFGLERTMTKGIVSNLNRSIGSPQQYRQIKGVIQVDAAINPGNSGGPLVNVQGRVIGINTAIIPSAQGIGFAIPAESVIKIIENLNANGRIIHPYLGIEMGDLTPAIRRYLELPQNVNGVVIGRVLKGGPANKAGLITGDVIIKIDGQETPSAYDLQGIVRSLKVGEKVKVNYIRDNKEAVLELTLEESPLSQNSHNYNSNVKAAGMPR